MDRQDAERVLALVADISADLRGKIVAERWWLVWIAVGVEMLIAGGILQVLIWHNETRFPVLAGVLGTNVVLIFLIIRLVHRRAGGQRTATETSIWWIWSTYILGSFGVSLFEMLAGWPVFSAAPIDALFAAFAFSMMAMVTHRYLLICVVAFLGVMLVMGCYPNVQMLMYGAAWFLVLTILGLYYRFTYVPHQARFL